MPAIFQSDIAKGIVGQPYPSEAGAVCAKRATITFSANPTVNDVVEMLEIPAGCRPLDFVFDADDLDTNGAPTFAFDAGIMSGTPGAADGSRTVGAEVLSGSNIAQSGATARPTLKTAFRIAASDAARSLGLKITGAAATFAAGTIGVTMFYTSD